MREPTSPFDLIRRQTLAAVWYEAARIAHGNVECLYRLCPHKIDMVDLLEAVSRVEPPMYGDESPPPTH